MNSHLSETKAKEKTLWFMFLRTVVNTLLLGITLFYQIKDSPLIKPQDFLTIYGLIALTYFVTTVFALLMPYIKNSLYFVSGQIIYDILFITALIYITGSHEATFTFLYLFTIAFSSLLYFRTGALYTASLTSICFSLLLILDPIPSSEKHLMTLFFNNVAFFLVALLSGYLSQQFQSFETSVRELQDLNQIIMDNMSSGLLTTDLQNHIIYFNKAAEHITGLSFFEIQNKNIFDVFPNLKRFWVKEISKKEEESKKSFSFRKSFREELTLGFALSTLYDVNQKPLGQILIFEDLTKILEMEQHLQRSDKLAAIGKLAAGIAHEIRNPLASVSGSIEVLSRDLQEVGLKEENQKLMNIILKETDRLNSLVNEFLDYVRPAEKKQVHFNLYQAIEETVVALSAGKSFPSNIHIHIETNQQDREFVGDKEKLKQVFWNLLLNAKQALVQGGNISIRLYTDKENVKIEVSDSGEGIEEKHIQKIFDPFFTTKPKGTGLGLSMVHKIIEAHQGRIYVSSSVGKGTTFTLILPIR